MAANKEESIKMYNAERPRVLVVEDDADLRTELVDFLQFYGIDAHSEGCVAGMLQQLQGAAWDVLVLDLGLPDGDGLAAARQVRTELKLPLGIVIATARGHVEERILGFKAGADAYLVKPVNPRELKAVIDHLLLRRLDDPPTKDWHLDAGRLRLTAPGGKYTLLTGAEARILARLLETPEQVVSREELCRYLAPSGAPDETRRLDSLLSRLRAKVVQSTEEELPLVTYRNMGYAYADKTGSIR